MKLYFRFILVFLCFFHFSNAQEYAVMSYNIRYNNSNDGENAWPNRVSGICQMLAQENPDIIGFQEVLHDQQVQLESCLNDYSSWSVGRDDGKTAGEAVPIFYKSNRFDKVLGGHFWLSNTPEIPGSKDWDAALTRMVSWLALKDKSTGKLCYVFNTHFDHIGQVARAESARIIERKIKEIAGRNPVVLLGDLNTEPNEAPYQILHSIHSEFTLLDAAGLVSEPTFCGFETANTNCKRIDYIFHSIHFTSSRFQVIKTKRNEHFYLSDHLAVKAFLRF